MMQGSKIFEFTTEVHKLLYASDKKLQQTQQQLSETFQRKRNEMNREIELKMKIIKDNNYPPNAQISFINDLRNQSKKICHYLQKFTEKNEQILNLIMKIPERNYQNVPNNNDSINDLCTGNSWTESESLPKIFQKNHEKLQNFVCIQEKNIIKDEEEDEEDLYLCPYCDQYLSDFHKFQIHLKNLHPQKKLDIYKCYFCNTLTSKSLDLASHLIAVHFQEDIYKKYNLKKYFCPFQEKYFDIDNQMELVKIINTTKFYIYKYAKQVQEGKEKQIFKFGKFIKGVTKLKQNPQGLFQCPICKREDFRTLNLLGSHLCRGHDIKSTNSYFCPHCNFTDAVLSVISDHIFYQHGSEDTNSTIKKFIYQSADNGSIHHNTRTLRKHIQISQIYHTLFNPDFKEG